jgi:hypothetical protein
MRRINIFGGEKGIVKCVDRGWSVVIPPKFSDQLSWKWRQQTSKSAMFLASLACLKNDRSTSSSYFTAQWWKPAFTGFLTSARPQKIFSSPKMILPTSCLKK